MFEDNIRIDLNPLVMDNVERMYDRYFQVAMTSTDQPILSFDGFVNSLLVRGIVEYDKQLVELEQKLGIIK